MAGYSLELKLKKSFDPKTIMQELHNEVRKGLNAAADLAIEIIEDRTAEGKGLNGTFKPYSKGYYRFKQKRLGGDMTVNLQWSGNMLRSMVHTVDDAKATIFFSSATEAKKAVWNSRLRPFFGLRSSEISEIQTEFNRVVNL